jgi:diguanylate cyclase (GGDEF)-like protein
MHAPPLRKRFQLRIGSKFLIVFVVLVVAIFAVPVAALYGLSELRDRTEGLYEHNVRTARLGERLANGVDDAYALALQLIPTVTERARLERLSAQLEVGAIPRVDADIAELRRGAHTPAERRRTTAIAIGWREFVEMAHTDAFKAVGTSREVSRHNELAAERVGLVIEPVRERIDRFIANEAAEARKAAASAGDTYVASRTRVLALAALAVLFCLGAFIWLIRDIVPRTREYSRFAKRVAAGEAFEPMEPRGSDELTSLGQTLNQMVARQDEERGYAATQNEFVDAMQRTEGEQEAHELLKRHLERSLPGSSVVVLNRNNSHDRLEPTTSIEFGTQLEHELLDASPRSCLAVRFGQTHEEGNGRKPLLECQLCGTRSSRCSTCEPLLVSGEVIGSVLVEHPEPLHELERERIRGSVIQAAPVLANLRNLAIAELRASTDALTGLPNNRALQGHMKRMVAQSMRGRVPLSVALLDLDHFKQINDTWGHGKGDEVLAAVGAVLESTLRDSDVVGRWGGEEFLLLLPDTDRDDAFVAAEKVREAIAAITVVGVERAITASLGVATLPEDGADIGTLTRHADRALYTAKARGRNRVERFVAETGDGVPFDDGVRSG